MKNKKILDICFLTFIISIFVTAPMIIGSASVEPLSEQALSYEFDINFNVGAYSVKQYTPWLAKTNSSVVAMRFAQSDDTDNTYVAWVVGSNYCTDTSAVDCNLGLVYSFCYGDMYYLENNVFLSGYTYTSVAMIPGLNGNGVGYGYWNPNTNIEYRLYLENNEN